MIQLLLHLIGDYILQSDKMAIKKTEKISWAALHSFIYSVPFFIVFEPSILASLIMFISHMLIDRFRLVRFLIFFKNWVIDRELKWEQCSKTGYPNQTPIWLSTWLLIIVDNTVHLAINYLVLTYL